MEHRANAQRILSVMLILLFLFTSHPVPAAAAGPIEPTELAAFFDEMMAQQMGSYHIPGAVVAIVQDGELLLAEGYGHADLEHQTPVDPEQTLFRIASITKLFTWTAVMQLVEQGKLDLDADVNDYLTGFQVPATYPQPVTLAHLMAHTAGFEDRGIGTQAYRPESAPPLAEYLAQHLPARVRPVGQVSMYSNHGAALAGHIVAQIAGTSYETYIAERILQPLEMAHSTAYQPLPAALLPNLAQSYAYVGGDYRATTFVIDLLPPAGAMSASATDMAHFMLAHLQGGNYGEARILNQVTVQRMHTQSFTHHLQMPGWAHGFQEMRINGRRALFHDGSLQNYVSLLLLVPEENLGLFVAYNSAGGGGALDELLHTFFDRYYPAAATALPQSPANAASRSRRLVGNYQAARRPYTTIEVLTRDMPIARLSTGSDGTLYFLGQQWVEVEPMLYQATESGDLLAFQADAQGRITGAALGAFALNRLRWTELPNVHIALLAICLALLLSALIGWPIAALIRRRRGDQAPGRLGRWLAGVAAALALVNLAALVATLAQPLISGLPPSLNVLTLVPFAIATLALGTLIVTIVVWARQIWSLGSRAHYTLVALALGGLLWLMSTYNLIGPHLG